MENRVKEVYGQIRMPEQCSQRIEGAMRNKQRNKQADTSKNPAGYRRLPGPAVALAAALLLVLVNGTAYAYTGEGIISRILSFANNAIFTESVDEEGNMVSSATLDTANATAPAVYKDGRLWFTANGENIDITEQISDSQAYIYDYRDSQGIKHYLILGGDPETFSYAEFLYDENKNPAWVGGYFTSGKVGETINPVWLENAKAKLGIPWP